MKINVFSAFEITYFENKFAVSRRLKRGGTSLYTKLRFKGNRYTKSVNTNDETLSNQNVDNFVSASYNKIKSSACYVGNPTNINNSLTSNGCNH